MSDIKKRVIPIYIILIVYLLVSNLMMFTSFSDVYVLLFNPLLLLFISMITYYLSDGSFRRIRNKNSKNKYAILIIIGYIVLYYLSGLIFGFYRNSFSLSFRGIVSNFISFFIVVIFKEYIRSKLICSTKKNYELFLITILFILIDIDFRYLFDYLNSGLNVFKYIFEDLVGIVLVNFTSTYLIHRIGVLPNYLYRGVITGISLFSIFLPNYDWLVTDILLILVLMILFLVIESLVNSDERRLSKRDKKRFIDNLGTWCLFIFVVVFVLFIVGFFKYQPIAILSDSMKGYFSKGDAVIIEKVSENDLSLIEIGDVIYYRYDDTYITHRVVDVTEENNSYVFKTKGDNNSRVDSWKVDGSDVVGVVKMRIKYIGWPSVLLNEVFG